MLHRRTLARRSITALVGLVLAAAGPAAGQTDCYWGDPLGGIFGDPGHWLPPGPPGPDDRAIFDIADTYTVTFTDYHTVERLWVDRGDVTFDLAGWSFEADHPYGGGADPLSVHIGDNAGVHTNCRLTVTNGDVHSWEMEIGKWEENVGELVVSTGAYWGGENWFTVGAYGTGRLTIEDGGVFQHGGAMLGFGGDYGTGIVTVTDPGSRFDVGCLEIGKYPGVWSGARGTLSVQNGAVATCDNAVLGFEAGATGQATVDGAGSLWEMTIIGPTSSIGKGGSGSVAVSNGGRVVVAGALEVGSEAGSDGSVIVDGVGSALELTNDSLPTTIGSQGGGSLVVRNGGKVTAGLDIEVGKHPGSRGAMTVSGLGSRVDCGRILGVGVSGEGSLSVEAGAAVVVWADFHIGMNSRASVTVTGAGSSVSCPGWGGLFVAYGNTGDASLTISDGASVSNVTGHVAFSPGSRGTVLVEGLGSLWKNSGSLLVGGASEPGGRATLTIRDGGRVTHGDGSRIFPGGTVCLEGGTLTGWSMLNEGLILGHGEVGSQVTNGQGGEIRVETGDRLLLGGSNGGNCGLISLQGGTMELAQALVNEGDGDVLGRGTLIAHGGVSNHGDIGLSNGISDLYGDVDNNAGGRVIVSGRADVTFWGDVANNAEALFKVSAGSSATFFGEYSGGDIDGEGEVYFEDDVTPGFSPAMVSFGGDVTFATTARLNVELANSDNSSPADPRFDALDVAGDVDLAGTLSVEWLPVPGDPGSKFGGIYSILTWGGTRAGTFDGIDCRMQAYLDTSVFPDGIEYDDGNSEVRIHLHDLLDGDADLDGRVAREDFHALEVGFGSPDPDWFDGDFNFDGRVDFLDYLTWKANAGDAVPGAVPEPTTLAILAVGIVVLTGRRRRR